MADNATVELGSDAGVDYDDHLRTYGLFVGLVKYGTVAVVVALVLLAFFLL